MKAPSAGSSRALTPRNVITSLVECWGVTTEERGERPPCMVGAEPERNTLPYVAVFRSAFIVDNGIAGNYKYNVKDEALRPLYTIEFRNVNNPSGLTIKYLINNRSLFVTYSTRRRFASGRRFDENSV